MFYYDKDEIKDRLTTDMVFDIVYEFGGEPVLTSFGFIAATICHNEVGQGSHKLYYYENTKLFRCYTGCDSTFDIFELLQKIKKWGLYDSVKWVAERYGWLPSNEQESDIMELPDWAILDQYDRLNQEVSYPIELKQYDDNILKHLTYPKIGTWIAEGITQEVMKQNKIGYYPGGEQITIPHYDINGRFIGLRGRAISQEAAELYGKYRPIYAGGILYNHPLGLNLYNLNNTKDNIKIAKKAIVVEGEKSVLKFASYFGTENNICVACCGSSLSSTQMQLLLNAGASEIIIGFDKQFQRIGDTEFKHLTKNLTNIYNKYKSYADISYLFDKWNLLNYKDSPLDEGANVFKQLYAQRVRIA